jgi:signal transduction histidine kinase
MATLDVSRLEVGRHVLELREVQLSELLEELEAEIHALVQEKPAVQFTWRVVPELPPLCTDRTKLKMVLKNLLSNAVKFTEQGSIMVDAYPYDRGVEICVADTGIGIPLEVQAVMFEMFRQGESSLTRQYGGSGLGLYIVKRMLELLGGTVTVKTEVGQGSTFQLWVPIGRPPDPVR